MRSYGWSSMSMLSWLVLWSYWVITCSFRILKSSAVRFSIFTALLSICAMYSFTLFIAYLKYIFPLFCLISSKRTCDFWHFLGSRWLKRIFVLPPPSVVDPLVSAAPFALATIAFMFRVHSLFLLEISSYSLWVGFRIPIALNVSPFFSWLGLSNVWPLMS